MTTHRPGKPAGIPARELIVPAVKRRHPAGRALLVAALATGAVATGTGVASATGAVANSCAAVAPVVAVRVAPEGTYTSWLLCGHGLGGITWATVETGPFYVTEPGRAPVCYAAGARYYPHNTGNGSTAVLTPTVRCTPTPANRHAGPHPT